MGNFQQSMRKLWVSSCVSNAKDKIIFLTAGLGPRRELPLFTKVCNKTFGIEDKILKTEEKSRKKEGGGLVSLQKKMSVIWSLSLKRGGEKKEKSKKI